MFKIKDACGRSQSRSWTKKTNEHGGIDDPKIRWMIEDEEDGEDEEDEEDYNLVGVKGKPTGEIVG